LISVAVAEGRNQVRSLSTIANWPEATRRALGKVGMLTGCWAALRNEMRFR